MIADVVNNAYKLAGILLPKRWTIRLFARTSLPDQSPLHPFLVEELHPFAASMEVSMTGQLNAARNKDLRAETDELMAGLRVLILKTAIQQYSRPRLLTALKSALGSYTCLMGTLYEPAVLLFIVRTVDRHFADMDIRDDELRGFWH
jgi:hypothetical protein